MAPHRAAGQETLTIGLPEIGERFASLRIIDPQSERSMRRSLEKYGQIMPVVVSRLTNDGYELLDGFKRLRAARLLSLPSLAARSLDLSIRAGKAAVVQLNRVGKSISSMEEALVIHSLCHEDGLTQVEIAMLFGRHKSWVCRRISLIERLSDEVQASIRLGLLPASLGAELARLQRRNQEALLRTISQHHLTWRETRKIVAALQSRPLWEHDAILRDFWGILQPEEHMADTGDNHLSSAARELRGQLLALERQGLMVAFLLANTELAQFEEKEERALRVCCKETLASIEQAGKELRQIFERA